MKVGDLVRAKVNNRWVGIIRQMGVVRNGVEYAQVAWNTPIVDPYVEYWLLEALCK